jgi:hypothetical protein
MTQTITFTDINDLQQKVKDIQLDKGERAIFHLEVDVQRSVFLFWENASDMVTKLQTTLDIDKALTDHGLLIVSKNYKVLREYDELFYHHYVIAVDYTVQGDIGFLIGLVVASLSIIGVLTALYFTIKSATGFVQLLFGGGDGSPSTNLTNVLEAGGSILVLLIILLLVWRWKG